MKMKHIKICLIVVALVFFYKNTKAQTYITRAEVISTGGCESVGGNYSNFGIIGETFVDFSVSGDNYNTSIGFLNLLDISTTNQTSNVASQDSLALVTLYNSTGGDNWTNKTNWLTGNVEVWHGVTVTNNRVSEINLSENNLVGSIPPELGQLTNLSSLWLSSNQLIGDIPPEFGQLINLIDLRLENNKLSCLTNLSALTKLTTFNISSNSFTFEDLESTKLNLEGKKYSPQDTLALTVGNVRINEGSAFYFTDYLVDKNSFTSTNSMYSIFKDGQLVYGPLNNFDLSIASLNLENEGKYNLGITNSTFPELKLISDTLRLKVNTKPNKPTLLLPENAKINVVLEPTLTWLCTDRDGDTAFKYSILFDKGSGLEKIAEINEAKYEFSSSDIKLEYLKTYSWAIVANDNVLDSEQSEVWSFTIKEENFAPTDIELSENTVDEDKNIGFIVGVFSTTDLSMNDEHVYSFVETNKFFEINKNQLKVKLVLDYETNYEHSIKIRSTDKEGLYCNKDFIIHVEDVYEDIPTGIEEFESKGYQIYPNPVKDKLIVSSTELNQKIDIQIMTAAGKIVFSDKWMSPFTHEINFTSFSDGLYFIRLQSNGNIVTRKVILVK